MIKVTAVRSEAKGGRDNGECLPSSRVNFFVSPENEMEVTHACKQTKKISKKT